MPSTLPTELRSGLEACRHHVLTAAAFSLALNVLHLAAPLYMMQVYDRVLSSGSGTTLVLLTMIVLAAYASLAGLDRARTHVLAAAGARIDRLLARRVFAGMLASADRAAAPSKQALHDFDTCRQFVTGSGMSALMDLPWVPLFVIIAFMLHSAIGWFTLASALVLVGLAVLSERLLRGHAGDTQSTATAAYGMAEASLANADSVRAMGMAPALAVRWWQLRREATTSQRRLAKRTADLAATAKFLRLSMQSLVLGVGAWLVLDKALSPGAIFASSLILGRALQPVEQVIAHWQAILAARAAVARVAAAFAEAPPAPQQLGSAPARVPPQLVVTDVGVATDSRAIVSGATFTIEAGDSVGVIGPSGAGKSTLVRVLAGAARPTVGRVTLGGLDISRAIAESRSPIGYLPQDAELFDDTVVANIARFRPEDSHGVLRAAMLAGAHELIMQLPAGYRCRIGPAGAALSGGMRRRIALARAVYGDPPLIVLDEPSANLDRAGDAVLERCIRQLQNRGTTLIVVSHRPLTTALMRKFLVVIEGRVRAYGPREEVVRALSTRLHPAPAPVAVRAVS
jgi:ATP-binding cassette, subfamily C, bacterial